jgi:hypothetical protein
METSSLRTLTIMPKNLNEIVFSRNRLQDSVLLFFVSVSFVVASKIQYMMHCNIDENAVYLWEGPRTSEGFVISSPYHSNGEYSVGEKLSSTRRSITSYSVQI